MVIEDESLQAGAREETAYEGVGCRGGRFLAIVGSLDALGQAGDALVAQFERLDDGVQLAW